MPEDRNLFLEDFGALCVLRGETHLNYFLLSSRYTSRASVKSATCESATDCFELEIFKLSSMPACNAASDDTPASVQVLIIISNTFSATSRSSFHCAMISAIAS